MRNVGIAIAFVATLSAGCSSPTGPSSGTSDVPGVSTLPSAQALTAMPFDAADATWIAPFWPAHMGIDFGMTTVGRFYSIGSGVVTEAGLAPGQGLAGTNYRIRIDYTSTGLSAEYFFEIAGSVPDQTLRDNILVAVGDRVTAGQHIGNLLSQGDGAHVHFGLGGGCPLEQFSPSVAAQLEALYGSGIELRPELPNLCNTSGPASP